MSGKKSNRKYNTAMTISKKSRAHVRYRTINGNIVPGVTTVLGILNKPALVLWANRLGLQGIDSTKYRDEAASIGTLAHAMVCAHLGGYQCDTGDYSKEQIDAAENSLLSYFEWERHNHVEPILVEEPLVSEKYHYGGTIDCLGRIGGDLVLIDHKTGKGIYDEMFYQLAAYKQLLSEAGHNVVNCRILRIGRDTDEGFEERVMTDLTRQWQIFEHCLGIYKLKAKK